MQNKRDYAVIYDDDLESGIDGDFDILILPSVDYITSDQMEELKNFLSSGKSIICSGSKLLFPNIGLNGYQNLESIFGLRNMEPALSENISYLHSILPNHLNHFRSDDHLFLQISNKNQPLVCEKLNNKILAYGFVLPEDNLPTKNSSIIYGTMGKGRFVWTGFDMNDVIGGSRDLYAFNNLILNAIEWMDQQPDCYISNFSDSMSSPMFVTLQYNNALESELIDVLQKNNIKPNLIVDTYQSISNEVLSKFNSDEIILEFSGNSDVTTQSISELIENFNQVNEISVSSILVEKQFLERINLSLLKNVGIDKILYMEQVPGLPRFANKDLLLIPVVKSNSIPNSNNVINSLYYNPKINCEGNPEVDLLKKITELKSYKYNFTSLSALKKWWNIRERITIDINNISDTGIELWVNNKNSLAVSDLNVFLNYVGKFDRKSLSISRNNALLEYHFDDASDAIVIKLENIFPNSINKIKIDFSLE